MKQTMQISTIVIIVVVIAVVGVGIYLRARTGIDPTIAPYEDLKRQVQEGTAIPLSSQQTTAVSVPLPWDEIVQISAPFERYFKMGEFVTSKEIKRGYEALTASERIVYQVWTLETEINNGGFDQYFFNSAGDHALETLETLRLIGSVEATSLLEQAIQVFGETNFPLDREERWNRMEALSEEERESWSGLDLAFYSLKEPMPKLVVDYLENLD